METKRASVHDNQVDLSRKGGVRYRDKACSGASCGDHDAGMRGGVRGHPLGSRDRLRNKRIAQKRSPGDRPPEVIRGPFRSGHVRVTTVAWTGVRMLFACSGFNVYQPRTLGGREGV